MAEIKCPCGLRNDMEEEDCKKTNCNACCPLTKPQTNEDRIRAMSNEELAELIVKHHPMHAWNKQVREIYFGFDDHRKDNPQKAWLEWLKQPAVGGSL